MNAVAESEILRSYALSRACRSHRHPFLFNRFEHLLTQSKWGWRIYEWVNRQTTEVHLRLALRVKGGQALSPYKAPFGGVEMMGRTNRKSLEKFLNRIEEDLRSNGIKHISIKCAPDVYQPGLTALQKAFGNLDYRQHREVTSIIPVNGISFDRKIKISERQKLRKAAQKFVFEQVSAQSARSVYNFIAACRKERNYALSMTFTALRKVIKIFPDHFLFFRVRNDDETGAACIAIRVSDQVLYTFYYAHPRQFDKISPVVLLLSGIYRYARENGIRLIDLGTSMERGTVKRSLLHFKKSVGGEVCSKYTFEKEL
jgi:hypothetical protein